MLTESTTVQAGLEAGSTCIKEPTLLNRLIKILMVRVNTGSLSDSHLHYKSPNPGASWGFPH